MSRRFWRLIGKKSFKKLYIIYFIIILENVGQPRAHLKHRIILLSEQFDYRYQG